MYVCKQCQGPCSIDRSSQQAGMMGKLTARGVSIATAYVRHKCLLLVSMFGTSVYFYCICPVHVSIANVSVRYKSLLLLSMSVARVYC
jgi:hypothetical protein